jgi:hypothetical protein
MAWCALLRSSSDLRDLLARIATRPAKRINELLPWAWGCRPDGDHGSGVVYRPFYPAPDTVIAACSSASKA